MSANPRTKWTVPEYLAHERANSIRHEYFNGEIFAMAGASREHNLITTNATAHLHRQLEARPCEVYQSDMRVKIDALGHYTYPDVVAVGGKPDLEDQHGDTLLNPTLIIEVLSPSTAQYDRNAKFRSYRAIPSLQEYVLISPDMVFVEHYTRQNQWWTIQDYTQLSDIIQLSSIACELVLEKVYAKITFEE
jgi:Uma2 family endonuclease